MSQHNRDNLLELESWRNQLKDWLNNARWTPEQLIAWLQGHDTPFGSLDDEPYIFLLRGLPPGGDRYQAEKALAHRIVVILNNTPDIEKLGKQPEKLLYNLLMLCAGLACAEILAEPLFQMFQRRKLSGNWRGVNLRSRLRDALIQNQSDDRLQPVWTSMVNQEDPDFLPGNVYDGLEGIRLLPSSSEEGAPALDAIGKSLKALEVYLEPEQDRRPKLRNYIKRVVDTYPGRPTWDIDLVKQADINRWSDWAVECLPSLCITLNTTSPQGLQIAWLWQPILQIIPEKSFVRESTLCNHQVLVVHLTEHAMDLVQKIAPVFERKRYSNPWPSNRAGEAIKIEAMTYWEMKMGGKQSKAAKPFREARKKRLIGNSLSLGAAVGTRQR